VLLAELRYVQVSAEDLEAVARWGRDHRPSVVAKVLHGQVVQKHGAIPRAEGRVLHEVRLGALQAAEESEDVEDVLAPVIGVWETDGVCNARMAAVPADYLSPVGRRPRDSLLEPKKRVAKDSFSMGHIRIKDVAAENSLGLLLCRTRRSHDLMYVEQNRTETHKKGGNSARSI